MFKRLGNKGLGGAKDGYETLAMLFEKEMTVATQPKVRFNSSRIDVFDVDSIEKEKRKKDIC